MTEKISKVIVNKAIDSLVQTNVPVITIKDVANRAIKMTGIDIPDDTTKEYGLLLAKVELSKRWGSL